MDSYKMQGEKVRWEQDKDTIYCFEQHPTKQQLYGHLPPMQNIQGYAVYCGKSMNEFIIDVLLLNPTQDH